MAAPIFFNVAKARRRLLAFGEVLTLRKRRETGHTVAYRGRRHYRTRLCSVVVEFAASYRDPEQLAANLEGSGFDTVSEWVSFAADDADTLYRVRRIGP